MAFLCHKTILLFIFEVFMETVNPLVYAHDLISTTKYNPNK